MNREPNNRKTNNLPDLFDEALELEETIVKPSFEEAVLSEESSVDPTDLSVDPTFFDEQVINVPIIDPPDMKSISSYPDTQIYDHLFSTDDDFLLDADAVEDVISSIKENAAASEATAPVEEIDEIVPIAEPEPDPVFVPEERKPSISVKKPAKKPPVKRAGMPKEEKVEAPEPIEEEKPVRRKPRVRRAGEKAATATVAAAATAPLVTTPAETDDLPPISLMEVNAPRKVIPKKPAGKPDLPQRRTAEKPGAPQKKAPGARSSAKSPERSASKAPSAKPIRSKAPAQAPEAKKIPEEKVEPKKRPFSPLEKMKKRLAQKWS